MSTRLAIRPYRWVRRAHGVVDAREPLHQIQGVQRESGSEDRTACALTVWLMHESRPRYSSMATSSLASVSIHMAATTNPAAATAAAPTGKRRPRLHTYVTAHHAGTSFKRRLVISVLLASGAVTLAA